MTLDDLGDRLFADIPQASATLGLDERTVRRAAAAGSIPASRIGAKWLIPVSWLREQAGVAGPPLAAPVPNPDELADRVADRVFSRLAGLFTRGACGDGPDPAASGIKAARTRGCGWTDVLEEESDL
jgi:excisionase family DNA binding protein